MSGVETPRTHAGARLLRDMGLGASVRTLYAKERRARMLRAILDIEYEAAAEPNDRLRTAVEFTAIPALLVFAADGNGGAREAVRVLRAALATETPDV